MTRKPHTFGRFIFLASIVLVTSFGGILTSGILTGGQMQDCPYMGMSGYCMDVTEHLAGWQQLFAATLEQLNPLALLSLLITFFVPIYFSVDLLARGRSERPLFERWRNRELFGPLRLAFARGLINPKLYS